jgi:hypothetical protein
MILRSTDVRGALKSRQRGFMLDPYRFAAAAPTGLLDAWTTNLIWAGGLRLLVGAYNNGPLIRVRRSGDSAESDFSRSGASVDLSAVAAWVVAGGGTQHGYVVTIYDQTGGGAHATNATGGQQPRIVNSGTAHTEIQWDGTGSAWGDDRLQTTVSFSSSASFTYFTRAWFNAPFNGGRTVDTSDISAARPSAFFDGSAGGMNVRFGGYFRPRNNQQNNNAVSYAYKWNAAGGSGDAGNRMWAGASEVTAFGSAAGSWSAPSAVTSEVIQIGNIAAATRGSSLRFKDMAVYRIAHADADIVTINGLLA